jgi:hypothetical protein
MHVIFMHDILMHVFLKKKGKINNHFKIAFSPSSSENWGKSAF